MVSLHEMPPIAPTGRHANPTLAGASDDEAALTIRCWAGPPHHGANSRGVAVASTEEDKRQRAELAQELGFYPASLDPADTDRHRRAQRRPRQSTDPGQDPPEVCTRAGGATTARGRSPWPCRDGRPVTAPLATPPSPSSRRSASPAVL